MKDDDTAALIAEARGCADAYEGDERNYWTANDRAIFDAENADLLRRLAAALSRAQADAARMRNALQYARNLIGPDEIVDAALEPRT